jgi:hypothetical protein
MIISVSDLAFIHHPRTFRAHRPILIGAWGFQATRRALHLPRPVTLGEKKSKFKLVIKPVHHNLYIWILRSNFPRPLQLQPPSLFGSHLVDETTAGYVSPDS